VRTSLPITLLLGSTLLAGVSLAAGDAGDGDSSDDDEPTSDVIAERTVQASPDAVYAVLADTERMSELAPERCMRKWEVSPDGETFEVVYLVELWRRKLQARVVPAEPGRRLEWDHLGKKGFVSRFTVQASEQEGATDLRLVTYIRPPGWPLNRYYHRKIRPGWAECYDTFLQAIATQAESGQEP